MEEPSRKRALDYLAKLQGEHQKLGNVRLETPPTIPSTLYGSVWNGKMHYGESNTARQNKNGIPVPAGCGTLRCVRKYFIPAVNQLAGVTVPWEMTTFHPQGRDQPAIAWLGPRSRPRNVLSSAVDGYSVPYGARTCLARIWRLTTRNDKIILYQLTKICETAGGAADTLR